MPRTPTDETVADWEKLASKVDQETRDRDPAIELAYSKLTAYLAEINQLITKRNFYEARKQEATHGIQGLLEKGRLEATFLRAGLKMRYGRRSETLVRFGIQPFRGQKRKKKKPEGPPDENG